MVFKSLPERVLDHRARGDGEAQVACDGSVGVTDTVTTPGEVSVMVPMVTGTSPTLMKSAGIEGGGIDVLAEGERVGDRGSQFDRARRSCYRRC